MKGIEEEKRRARVEGETKRRALSDRQRKRADEVITLRVLAHPEVQKANILCVYVSLRYEVDTKKIIQQLILDRKVVVPPESQKNNVDVFLVPGVAFDVKGNRLGRGKGYYDRLLAHVKGFRIGLAYSCQVVAEVPHTGYDIPMHCIISEKEGI